MTDTIPPLVVINPDRVPFKNLPQLEVMWHQPVISLSDLIAFENQINFILDWHPLNDQDPSIQEFPMVWRTQEQQQQIIEDRFRDLQHIRETFFEL